MRSARFLRGIIAAAGLAGLMSLPPSTVASQVLITPDLREVCAQAPLTHRRTIAYLDVSAIDPNELEWGLTVLNRLELAPREWLTVLAVNAIDYSVKEVFNLCYPALTKAEIATLRADRSLWDRLVTFDPEDQQAENIEMFDSRLRLALDGVRDQAVNLDRSAPRRNILGALAFDKNRFADKQAYTRAVIFSDGRIVEEGVDLSKKGAGDTIRTLVEKYPANFGGAEILIFGISAAGGAAADPEVMRGIFESYFLANHGQLRSFSFALPEQAGTLFAPPLRYEGKFHGGGVSGEAVLSYIVDGDDRLSGGWLTFATGAGPLNVPIEGDIACDGDACSLKAHVTHDVPPAAAVPFFKKGDLVALKGTAAALKGTLEAAVPETFEGGAETVVYSLDVERK